MTENPKANTIVIAAFAAIFAAAAGTHALTPIFPELKAALGVGDGAVRLLTAVFTLGYSVSGFVLGIVCDRAGRRRVLLPSLGLYAAASAGLSLAPETLGYGSFLVLRVLAGLGTGGVTAAVLALTSDAVPFERRGRAMSFVLAGSYAAVLLGVPLASLLATWRLTAVFAVLAVVGLVNLALLAKVAPRSHAPVAATGWFDLPRRALRLAGARAALATTLLNTLATFAVLTSLADHAVDRFGASLSDRSLLFLVLGLGALPGGVAAGLFSDRVGKRRSVIVALVGSLALTPVLLPLDSFPAFLWAAAAVSFIQALRQGPFAAILTELAPESLRGSLLGWNSAVSGIGLGAGTWLGGVAYASTGLAGAIGLTMAALAFSLALFASRVPERPQPTAA